MGDQGHEGNASSELVWGHWRFVAEDGILVIPRSGINRLRACAAITKYLYGNSWVGVVEELDELPEDLRKEVRSLVDEAIDNAWEDLKWAPEAEPPTRPEGWYPSDEDYPYPFSDEWITERPNPENPEYYSLPTEIRELGAIGFSMVGTTISFDLGQLSEIERVAGQLGLRLVHDDEAINACWPSL